MHFSPWSHTPSNQRKKIMMMMMMMVKKKKLAYTWHCGEFKNISTLFHLILSGVFLLYMEGIFSVCSLRRRELRPQVIHCLVIIHPSIHPSITHLSTHPSISPPIHSPTHLGNKLMTLHWAPYGPHSSFAWCVPPPTSPGFLGFWILSGAASGVLWEETEGGRTPQLYYLFWEKWPVTVTGEAQRNR